MIGPRHLAACAAALALAALPGCLGDSEGTKAGGEAGPLTRRVGTDDPAGRPGEEQIQELARRLAELSDGELRLKPVLNAGGDGRDWDQLVAHRVADGDLDLGLVPSRAFDTEGVTTLRALNAPFLITGDELFGEVIAGPLASRLMSGLDEAGVVGLAMFPEGMRHPFGFQKPLRGPGDYAGQEIRTPTSETVTAMFAALGARTDDMDPDAGVQAGMESAYDLQPTGTATGNVTFYPKADVLVVSPGLLDKLGEERTEILRRAARETRDLLIEQRTSDADAAAAWCDDGHSIALAGDAELAALERATEPVYDALERDPVTRELIAAIRDLKERASTPELPSACGAPDGSGTGAAGADSRLDGVYRFESTDAQLRRAGVTDPVDVDENHGLFTVTLQGGEYCWKQRAPNPLNNPDECSTYELDGDRMTWNYPTGPSEVYRVRKLANGDLKLSVLRAEPEELPYARAWSANVWRRIATGE
jgi:TRAP-type C4-dicarboxylate transport system substrate-binding protein